MEHGARDRGLGELEDNLGSPSHPKFTAGELKHLERRIFDRERITDYEWEGVVNYLIDNKTFLPKVKDFIEALHSVRKSRGGAQGTKDRERVYVKCERCNPTGAQNISYCGFLYTRQDRWDTLERQVVPCGCGNTPLSMADVPTFQQLRVDGKIQIDDVERPDGSYLFESADASLARMKAQADAARARLRADGVIKGGTISEAIRKVASSTGQI